MRITSGTYGGRTLHTPDNKHVRPSTDKVRQAIFNSLKSKIDLQNCKVLDGTAGTGAMGIESLSRGASFCQFIDNHKNSIDLIKSNITKLNINPHSYNVIRTDIRQFKSVEVFDLIFLDPPYNQDLLAPMTKHIITQGLAHNDTLFVLEEDKNARPSLDLSIIDEKTYGRVRIIYAKIPE